MTGWVRRAFKYRFYPTGEQAAELSRTFGCVRLVYNKALEERTRGWYGERRRITYPRSSAALSGWKETEELAFGTEVSSVPLQQALPDAAVGIDAGLTSLVTLSTGEKVTNPKHERKDRARLARARRELSRKAKGSANRAKARRGVARVYPRTTNRRRDFPHTLPTRLVRENQTVVIEDPTVRDVLKNGTLARAISDTAWTDLRSMLEYKCAWYRRELAVIDRRFPNPKPRGARGTVAATMPLNVRERTCDRDTAHDRDLNAARDIKAAGLAASACGDGVRPQRESSRTGSRQ